MSIKLGKIMGFPIELDWTWFVVFVLMVGAVQSGLILEVNPAQYSRATLLFAGVIGCLLFFASLVGHELSHCWVARQFGIPIAGITLFIFGGVARMKNEPQTAGDELKMALAGPLFSLLAGLFFFLVWGAAILPPLWSALFRYLGWANLVIALFNLVPAFPTDGGRALRAVVWGWTGNVQAATKLASRLGQTFGWLLVFFGIVQFLKGQLMDGIWLGLIGFFLQNAAQSAYEQLLWRKAVRGLLARDLMDPQPLSIPPDATVEQAVLSYFFTHPVDMFPVTEEGRVAGVLHVEDVRQCPREQWGQTLVSDLMKTPSPSCMVAPDQDAWDILTDASPTCGESLLVVQDGVLVGTLTQDTLARQLRLRMQLPHQ